ncbi:hypothetical protein HMPREF1141_2155 [Clostridium sp. MSTE9]|nr:hypothetical protein HMPREF1141_2155 [Clostridium sp. MSTE9]
MQSARKGKNAVFPGTIEGLSVYFILCYRFFRYDLGKKRCFCPCIEP